MQRPPKTIGPIFVTLLFAFLTCGVANGQENPKVPEPSRPGQAYYDLGGFHYQVSTDSDAAQQWFDRGLAMCIGFNHEEAVRCFQQALVADPSLAMAYWGIAYAWGPNINNMEIEAHQITQADLMIQLASLQSGSCTQLERDLIESLGRRYAAVVPEDREPLNRAYAESMRELHKDHPDEPLVAMLFAESLMNLQPWKHWSPAGEPALFTEEIVTVLEDALQRWPTHPGLCHLYIHVMEASPTPAKALAPGAALGASMPGQGHLVHMPSHIDVLLGNYDKVIAINQKAIAADTAFAQREGRHNFYTLYRIHNYHFLVYGAMFDGQSELALQSARDLVQQIPEDMLQSQTDFLDAFVPTALHVLVRFGRWEDILEEAEPADYLPMSRSIRHYARALAFAATGRVDDAKVELASFRETRAQVPETSFLFQNASQDILGVAEAMIEGEIAYREGDFDKAFEHLREAVVRDDGLNYDEPWGWMQPTRHALGALLLEQGRLAESEQVYRADLKRHPKNPWSLHGLAESLRRQGKLEAADDVRKQFTSATQRCDVSIDRSCFCRLQP